MNSSSPPPSRASGARVAGFAIGTQRFVTKGLPRFDLRDPYYFAVTLSWKRFALAFVLSEFVINAIFAGLYTLAPDAIANQRPPGFLSSFFFSLETLATVGYGEMYPATTYGHLISSLEIVTGLVFTAMMTGLLFIRFSRPKARMIYADNPVVAMQDGRPTLMLRLGHLRNGVLHQAKFSLHVLTRTVSAEGTRQVNIIEVPLVRPLMPVLSVLFTMRHTIDEDSPLHGLDPGDEGLSATRLFVTMTAKDPATGQEVSDLHSFVAADIRFGMRYVDAVEALSPTVTLADYGKLSQIEPDGAAKV